MIYNLKGKLEGSCENIMQNNRGTTKSLASWYNFHLPANLVRSEIIFCEETDAALVLQLQISVLLKQTKMCEILYKRDNLVCSTSFYRVPKTEENFQE